MIVGEGETPSKVIGLDSLGIRLFMGKILFLF